MTLGDQHWILFYEYVEDILERRGPHREAHLERVRARREAGDLLMAGALGDPPHGAAFVFRGAEPVSIEAFVEGDPYVQAELVRSWRLEHWNVV
jgi:uncharacterized protein YciI